MNWEEIRNEYETSDITLKALAEKHGIKDATLRSRKNREKWQRNGATRNATQHKNVATERNELSWVDIENEYVTDIRKKPCTLKELADRYGVSMSRIEKYAAEHDWSEKRKNHAKTVQRKTAEKTAELISDDLSVVTARHLRLSDKLMSIVEKALEDENEMYKVVEKIRTGYSPGVFDERIEVEVTDALNEAKLLNVVNTVDKLQKMQRQTLGILDAKDQHKIDMDKRKIGDGEEEYEDDGFLDALESKTKEVWNDVSDPAKENS